jgi:hypothetical protein
MIGEIEDLVLTLAGAAAVKESLDGILNRSTLPSAPPRLRVNNAR